jgi:hypothetical protein
MAVQGFGALSRLDSAAISRSLDMLSGWLAAPSRNTGKCMISASFRLYPAMDRLFVLHNFQVCIATISAGSLKVGSVCVTLHILSSKLQPLSHPFELPLTKESLHKICDMSGSVKDNSDTSVNGVEVIGMKKRKLPCQIACERCRKQKQAVSKRVTSILFQVQPTMSRRS